MFTGRAVRHYRGVYSGGLARALRAALFALVCVSSGTGLHLLADGCSPGVIGPALALPIVWLAAFGLARRERSVPVVVLALGVAQLGLHVELGWFCPKYPAMPGMPGYPGADAGVGGMGHGAVAMVAAHALAVAVCGAWLGRGERCFFELCRAVAFLAAPAADLLRGLSRQCAALRIPPRTTGIHVTAPRTVSPPQGPAPSPRILRGPPLPAPTR
jgi:hypothetical protein